jgi:DNA-binding transcriptional MocR family regulator
LPEQHLADAFAAALEHMSTTGKIGLGTYHHYGIDLPKEHRELGARWLGRFGVDAPPDQVMITAGAHAALMIILFSANLSAMPVLAPALTYAGLRNIGMVFGRRMIHLEHDGDGVRPDSVEAACRRGMGQILFLQTAVDNPLCITMPLGRREELARIARRYDLIVIEDNATLIAPQDPIPPIASLIPERTFLISSTAKCLSPSVSLGFVLAPPGWANQLVTSTQTLHVYPSPLNIALVEQMMQDGALDAIWRKNRDFAARRASLAVDILGAEQFRPGKESHYGWLDLPEDWQQEAFTTAARHEGVSVAGGQNFALPDAGPVPNGVRLSLTGPASDEKLTALLMVLKTLLGEGSGDIRATG